MRFDADRHRGIRVPGSKGLVSACGGFEGVVGDGLCGLGQYLSGWGWELNGDGHGGRPGLGCTGDFGVGRRRGGASGSFGRPAHESWE